MLKSIALIRLLLVCALLALLPTGAAALNLNGNWDYRQSGSDLSETQRQFSQSYSLGVGQALTYKPSHALSASAGLGYTQRQSDSGNGLVKSETITPTATISLLNDIFLASLSGNTSSTRRDSGRGSNNSSWDSTLASRWSVPYFPTLRFSYSERWDNSQDEAFLASPEVQSNNFNAGLAWDLYLADFSYNFSQTVNEDLLNRSRIDNQAHFLRLEGSGTIWDNRLRYNYAQQASFSTQRVEQTGGNEDLEEDTAPTVEIPVGLVVATALTDDNASLPALSCQPGETAGEDCLVDNNQLRDEVFNPSFATFSVAPDERLHLAVTPSEMIDRVTISVDALVAAAAATLQWSLYEYDFAGDSWVLADDTVTATLLPADLEAEDEGFRQLQFAVASDRRFMLVADNISGLELGITEVEVASLRASGFESDRTQYLSNFGLRYRISRTVSTGFNLTWEQNESGGVAASGGSDRITLSSSLRWAPVDFFSTNLGVSEYREIPELDEELINRNYSLVFTTLPLENLNVSLGARLNERYVGSQKTLTNIRYSLNSKAQLYPDLSAAMSLAYSQGERWQDASSVDAEDFPGHIAESSGFSSRLDLNAKLYEKLTGDLTLNYSDSQNDGIDSQSASLDVGLRSRLSDLLAVRGSYRTELIDSGQSDRLNLSLDLRVIDNRRTRLTMIATHTQADTMSDALSLTGSWLVNNRMSLIGRGNYRISDINSYSFRLSLSFSL